MTTLTTTFDRLRDLEQRIGAAQTAFCFFCEMKPWHEAVFYFTWMYIDIAYKQIGPEGSDLPLDDDRPVELWGAIANAKRYVETIERYVRESVQRSLEPSEN